MELKFFGRGTGFSTIGHNSAYYMLGDTMIMFDCPMSTFYKLFNRELLGVSEFKILITHTHPGHISGLSLFIQYAYFTLHKPVLVITPSNLVCEDVKTLLGIEGCDSSWYKLVSCDTYTSGWLHCAVKVEHSPQLENKCYGYVLDLLGTRIIYSGDTNKLDMFYPYLDYRFAKEVELYIDISVHDGMVHLKLTEILPLLKELTKKGIKVYLMHLDDISSAKDIIENIEGIEVVEVE